MTVDRQSIWKIENFEIIFIIENKIHCKLLLYRSGGEIAGFIAP